MPTLTVKCPYCNEVFPLDDALVQHLRETVGEELEGEFKKRLANLEQRERRLKELEERLSLQAKQVEEQVQKRVAEEITRIEAEARKKAEEDQAAAVQALQEELEEQRRKLREAEKAELKLRKERQELEAARERLELDVARRLDEERQRLREEALKAFQEKHALELRDKEEHIRRLTEQIEELRRRAEQGSQQRQGEVMETTLEQVLRENFPSDVVQPIRSGQRGADVRHEVYSRGTQRCGTILWESKRAARWQPSWISKLREDQREARADVAVLVATCLPKDVNGFGFVDGVWVCDLDSVLGLACVLRMHLTELANERLSAIGRSEKAEALYQYLHTSEFRQRFEGVVRAFVDMKKELDREKAAVQAQWARREKQIARVLENIAGMYGDLQGITGGSLPEIQYLEVSALPEQEPLSALPPAG